MKVRRLEELRMTKIDYVETDLKPLRQMSDCFWPVWLGYHPSLTPTKKEIPSELPTIEGFIESKPITRALQYICSGNPDR